jgi:hypothetical protein
MSNPCHPEDATKEAQAARAALSEALDAAKKELEEKRAALTAAHDRNRRLRCACAFQTESPGITVHVCDYP